MRPHVMLGRFKKALATERATKGEGGEFRDDFSKKIKMFTPNCSVMGFSNKGEISIRRDLKLVDADDLLPSLKGTGNSWVLVRGIHELAAVSAFAEQFAIYPMLVESICTPGQRPKLDEYPGTLCLVFRLLEYDEEFKRVCVEQVSVVVQDDRCITFQEGESTILDRIAVDGMQGRGRLKSFGFSNLVFTILDAVVEQYFITVARITEDIEELEEQVLTRHSSETLMEIYRLKREVLFLKKSLMPMREMVARFSMEHQDLGDKKKMFYLGSLQQDLLQVVDAVDTLREMLSEMLGVYMSRVDLRMNAVGQVLSVVATVFIPMTFITGWFGMNFPNLPFLDKTWGYVAAGGSMVVLSVAMVLYFRKKKLFDVKE